MNVNPKSLENLRPPWTPETAPRSRGRKNAGLSVNEWRNELADKTRAEIVAVRDDASAPAAKVMAAVEALAAMDGGDKAIERVCDYTNGKPKQSVDVNTSGQLQLKSPEDRDAALHLVYTRIQALLKPGAG